MSILPHETIYKVRGYDCGYGGPFRPLALANYFQEAASDHAAILGVGRDEMFGLGRTWMLSRLDIEARKLPSEGDEILMRTWPAGTDRLFACRCLEMRTIGGELLAGGLYHYLIVDMERRRPLRPEKILDPELKSDREPPFDDLSPGLQDNPGFSELGEFRGTFTISAGARHIDHNAHVNSGHLLDWLCDAVPADQRGSGKIARIKVDYVAELLAGESVEARWKSGAQDGPDDRFSILVRNGELIARALTRWQ
jgi:acyl-ACP thioesterase